jgi:hypothetical protein
VLVVKSVSQLKRVGVEVVWGSFTVYVAKAAGEWELNIYLDGKPLFSATGETREAVLRALDDFIAELVELSRMVESAAKRVEDMAESLAEK